MYRQHYLKAVEEVLSWDLSDDVLTDAINTQVMHAYYEDDDWHSNLNQSKAFN